MALFRLLPTSLLVLLVLLLSSHHSVQGRINKHSQEVGLQSDRQLQNDDNNYNNANYNNANYNNGAAASSYQGTQPEICEDGIVQVTSIQVVCDSPYTFYYGNGAKRNSQNCNFGDKATISVYFNVVEDLDTNIYMVMNMYAGYGNEILTSTSPKKLNKYVGYTCNAAGSYSFTFTSTIGSASSGSSNSFVPYVQIAFSSESNGDYNLGAANIPCNWDDREFGEWTEIAAMNTQWSMREFLIEYGIIIGVVIVCSLFVAIFARRTMDNGKFIKQLRSMRATQAASTSADHNNNNKSSALIMPHQAPEAV